MSPYSPQVEDCVRHLMRCHRSCMATAMTHCLEGDSRHSTPQHIRLMLDCAAICSTTADALLRKSQFHTRLAELCADICETCARDCETQQGMDDCVMVCRSCAEICRSVARLDHAAILKAASETPPGQGD